MRTHLHRWLAQIQRDDGVISEREVLVGWDPSREGMADLVAVTAAAEETCEGERVQGPNGMVFRWKWVGLTAVFQGATDAAA